MIEPPFAHQRQRLLDREDRTLHIGVEGFVNVLGRDLAEAEGWLSRPGIGEDDGRGFPRSAFTAARRVGRGRSESEDRGPSPREALGPEVRHSGVERFPCRRPKMKTKAPSSMRRFCRGAADAGSANR